MQSILALDYGGTKLTAGITTLEKVFRGEWRQVEVAPTPASAGGQAVHAEMVKLAKRVLAASGALPAAVGVSFGGPVDESTGSVRCSHQVHGWDLFPLRQELQREFGVPAKVVNDANAGALGEWQVGTGGRCGSLLYVTVSTGIGAGWVLNGRIFSGADGVAGELGHTVVRPNGMLCQCGLRGCLETEAAGPAIVRKMRERLGPNFSGTGADVAQAAERGDETARAVMAEVAGALGLGLGIVTSIMNPERIVLGGGVTKAGERYWAQVREATRASSFRLSRVAVTPAVLGDRAPLCGAALAVKDLLKTAV